MRTRCPVCSTVFRVTSEQLRLKLGKVRCGHCQAVFNAFDQLQNETLPSERPPQPRVIARPAVPEAPVPSVLVPEPVDEPVEDVDEVGDVEPEPVAAPAFTPAPEVLTAPEPLEVPVAPPSLPLVGDPAETPEASTSAAREAGLMAARDLIDTPAYNRWAEGTLAGSGFGGFAGDTARRPAWPFVLASILLTGILLSQLCYYFRTDLVLRWPASSAIFSLLAVDVPLPRNADLVLIETSDLQSDNARGLFVLQATLRNRAGYAQAWPALELTLTDIQDSVVSRRVLSAADYLPPSIDSAAFPANAEIPVKLWVEAKAIGAAGYRLYLFYP